MSQPSPSKFSPLWVQSALSSASPRSQPEVHGIRQTWGSLRTGCSITTAPICLGGVQYKHGLGTHADSVIRVSFPSPARQFRATAGLDQNTSTLAMQPTIGSQLIFSVEVDGQRIWQSGPATIDTPVDIDVPLPNVNELMLLVEAVDGVNEYAHADWADARAVMADGTELYLGDSLNELRLPKGPIFSFNYNGRPSSELLQSWDTHIEVDESTPGLTLYRKTYADPDTKLTCALELKEFVEHDAVEWVVRFRNDGTQNTPILSELQSMQIPWACIKDVVLHRSKGSRGEPDDFSYRIDALNEGDAIHMIAGDGRSSTNWLPYFSLETEGRGVVIAVGWTGEWAASIQRTGEQTLSLTAGMDLTHLTMYPDEEIRTPSAALIFWEGEPIDGSNALRRFIMDFHSPQMDGEPALPPLTSGNWGGSKTELHLELIETIKQRQLHFDYYWIDAGWYGTAESWSPVEISGKWYTQAGNWYPNPAAHPNGMRVISDAAHDAGMGFLLWFEPERAKFGTQLPDEHPEWFLTVGECTDGSNMLLDLGNDEARRWLTDFISDRITEWNIDCFRQDFNFEPLPYWRENDAPDRQGMLEIKHITGLYAFWDELLRRHPHLLIDNCASGGRRLDLEMTGRGIPLWRSDFQVFNWDPFVTQIHSAGLNYWLPWHGTTPHFHPGDTYNFRSTLAAAMGFGPPPVADQAGYDWEWHNKMLADYRRARPLFSGDYYPLLAFNRAQETWTAYQMNRPDSGDGMVVVLRRDGSPFSHADMKLRGLDPDIYYQVENADTGIASITIGADLMATGLSMKIPDARSSLLFFYNKVGGSA